MTDTDTSAIDELTATFFNAFTNRSGAVPDVDCLYRLFVPQAIIVKNTGGSAEIYDVAGFVEPRRALLTNGSLTDFCEEETWQQTEIFGNIAHRLSRYRKSWIASGEAHAGGGIKSLQLVRTPEGWRVASLVWEDDASGYMRV